MAASHMSEHTLHYKWMYGDFVHFDSLIDIEVISKVLFAYKQSNKSKRKDWETPSCGHFNCHGK